MLGRREESAGRGLGRLSLLMLPELVSREWVLSCAVSRRPLERRAEEERGGLRGSTGEQPVMLCVDLTRGLGLPSVPSDLMGGGVVYKHQL